MFPRLKEINKELEKTKLRKMELSSLEYYGIKNVEDELKKLDLRLIEIQNEKKKMKTDILLLSGFTCISIGVIISGVLVFKMLIDYGLFNSTGGKLGAVFGSIAAIGLIVLSELIRKRVKVNE